MRNIHHRISHLERLAALGATDHSRLSDAELAEQVERELVAAGFNLSALAEGRIVRNTPEMRLSRALIPIKNV